ncbi:MAG: hypothetical protein AB7P97_19315 [Hyphomonadaceae bacterium]
MTENSWVLRGVDPTIREQAAEEAARLGMSLGDYLTDVVVRSALTEQLAGAFEAEPAQDHGGDDATFAISDDGPETSAVRRRLHGLEKRLHGAVHGLDDAVADLSGRLGEVEGLAADTAQSLTHTVAGLRIDLSDLGDNLKILAAISEERAQTLENQIGGGLGGLREAQEARAADLDDRIDVVETIARTAQRAAAELGEAHETLTRAVAGDFAELADQLGARLQSGLEDISDTANEAAARADAAVAHLLGELRSVRESFDARLEESAADTRARMHAAFADAADRLALLAGRVVDNERRLATLSDSVDHRIAATEDAAQTALEETASTLRAADAELARQLSRTAQDQSEALDAARSALNAEIGALKQNQAAHITRLDHADTAIARTVSDLEDVRDALTQRVANGETQVRALLDRAEREWAQRFEGQTQATTQLLTALTADIERVEACTHAALQKLARDLTEGDAGLSARFDQLSEDVAGQLQQMRGQAEAERAMGREEHAGAVARLSLLDGALAKLEAGAAPTDARLSRLETALAAMDHTLPGRVAELEAHAEESQALAQRIDAQRALINDTGEQIQDVARVVNRLAAQSAETAAKTEARVHNVEMTLADLRLERIAADAPSPAAAAAVQALDERVAAIEAAQARAIDAITADIARFVAENERRLASIESPNTANHDLATAFDALRKRVEDRILGVEQRSVRMLEQVADTVAMIEQRFVQGRDDADARTA